MLKPEDASVDQTVFFIETWSGTITRAVITEIHENYAKVKCQCVVDSQDQEICKSYGSCSQSYEKLFTSAADAYTAKQDIFVKQVDTYCSEITSIKDLLLFALSHTISDCDEYRDDAAIEAFKRRSKELYKQITGTDLSFPD